MAGTREIAKAAGVDGDLAKRFVDELVETVKSGDRVTIRGLGSFQTKTLAARTFQTAVMKGGPVTKPQRETVGFRPSSMLLEALNPTD
jgi:nucleoid DNA-binding protein